LIQRTTYKFFTRASSNRLAIAILTCLLLAGCSTFKFPLVHRITIQQGNVITQTMIDKLKPGMTRSQVRFVLGNPVLDDSLNRDRWDYVYTAQLGSGDPIQKVLQVYFIEERLSHFEGDFIPTDNNPDKEAVTAEA
jgi:outer membrane protein assembly factor BamE